MSVTKQYSRPMEDTIVGEWDATPLWQKIDESPASDLDFVSTVDPGNDTFQVKLSAVDYPLFALAVNQKLTVRLKKEGSDTAEVRFRLLQGTQVIASRTVTASSSFTDYELELSQGEIDEITDYGNLYLEVRADILPAPSSSSSSSSSTPSSSSSSSSATLMSQCRFPGGAANGTGTDVEPWTNVNNVKLDDGNYATNALDDARSYTIDCSDFGFSIPELATIVGIVVNAGVKDIDGANVLTDATVRLTDVSGPVGETKNDEDGDGTPNWVWSSAETEIDFGGTNDLWGTTWSPAHINDSSFGCQFTVTNPEHEDATAAVDYIEICVYYTV